MLNFAICEKSLLGIRGGEAVSGVIAKFKWKLEPMLSKIYCVKG